MKNLHILSAAGLFCTLLAPMTVSADAITAFSATAIPDTSFTIDLNSTFTSTVARITNSSVACNSDTPCSGEVATFSLTLGDITTPTPAMGTLDGTLTGSGTAEGTVNLFVDGFPFKTIPFSVEAGPFSKDLFSTEIPTSFGETLVLSGSLDLSLPAGDSFVLPDSLEFAIGEVPEPSGLPLICCAVIGLAALARRLCRS
jgi:hypothetical protein